MVRCNMVTLGIPKEVKQGEGRVALVPNDVGVLLQEIPELTVYVARDAGKVAGFSNEDYEYVGAKIAPYNIDRACANIDLYKSAQYIVKVKEPQQSDLEYLNSSHTLFGYLHLPPNPDLVKSLCDTGCTAIALEKVEMNGKYPLLNPMSEIAGKISIQTAANYLYTSKGGKGILLGGIAGTPKGQVTILGAGTAGRSAAILAANMGANVTVYDKNPEALRIANTMHPNIEGRFISSGELEKILPITDILIGAILVPGSKAPKIVSEDMVKKMEAGSVIVDISADEGGCIETIRPTTHSDPVYVRHGVIHCGIQNLPGAVPRTSSIILSGTIRDYVKELLLIVNYPNSPIHNSVCIKKGNLVKL